MTNILYPSQNSQGQIEQYNKQYFTSNQAHPIFPIFFFAPIIAYYLIQNI